MKRKILINPAFSEKKNMKKIFGKELILNLYNCHPGTIRSRQKILEYSNQLCDLIKVKKYGKAIVKKFGEGQDFTKGFSLVQLIETSLVSGHFSELWNSAFINIFSCKPFNAEEAAKFTKKFFRAKKISKKIITR